MTPEAKLYRAIKHGYLSDAKEAIAAGADVAFMQHRGKSLLRLAGEGGHGGICELLIGEGLTPNESSGERNYSLLHNAVATENYGFAMTLLNCGAWHSPRTSSGATPLHFAARSGQQLLAGRLIEAGADVNAKNSLGQTPLHLAVRKNDSAMEKFLLKRGADKHAKDECGMTPYRLAQILGHSDSLEFLPEMAHGPAPRRNCGRNKKIVADGKSHRR